MPIGLIAGNGTFPFLVLRAARRLGHDVTVVAIQGEASRELDAAARELGGATVTWIALGQLGKCISTFTDAGVTRAVMAGQVKHVKLFGGVLPDLTLLAVLRRLTSKNTDALIAAVAAVLEERGITLMDSTALLADLLAKPGVLTRRAPNDPMRADFEVGYRVADVIAGLDVGQLVVVKDRAVVAVEAMEGTDAMLRRAAALVEGKPLRLVKGSRRRQHLLFDVPVVGPQTIEVMKETGTTALAIDVGRTLLLDRDELLLRANAAGIAIIAG